MRPLFFWYRASVDQQNETWLTRLPLQQDRPWLGYGLAVVVAAIAFLVRVAFDAVLPPGFPYVTFFPAVVAVAVLFGPRPGMVTAALGLVLAWYFFIPPQGFGLTVGTAAALGLYLFVVAVDIVLIHWLQRANAETHAARETSRALAEMRETLFHELQHRVGNNLQMVGALLSLQRRKLRDPAAVEAIEEAAQRVNLIGRIQRQLYEPGGERLGIAELLERVLQDNIETSGRRDVGYTLQISPRLRIRPELAIPTSLIVSEAVANALEHGFAGQGGTIRIEAGDGDGAIAIAVIDDGCGLPDGFVMKDDQNLGLKLSTSLARQFGGSFAIETGGGSTCALLRLPDAAA